METEKVRYAGKALMHLFELLGDGKDAEARLWGKVVDALYADNGPEAALRCREGGFPEKTALEILKIFS